MDVTPGCGSGLRGLALRAGTIRRAFQGPRSAITKAAPLGHGNPERLITLLPGTVTRAPEERRGQADLRGGCVPTQRGQGLPHGGFDAHRRAAVFEVQEQHEFGWRARPGCLRRCVRPRPRRARPPSGRARRSAASAGRSEIMTMPGIPRGASTPTTGDRPRIYPGRPLAGVDLSRVASVRPSSQVPLERTQVRGSVRCVRAS